jgi:PBP1b-binding outer membrane lipoprotein LpoB
MRRIFVLLSAILICSCAFAQKKKKAKDPAEQEQTQQAQTKKELPPPFKGGVDSMFQFFKDNLRVSPEIIKAKASGVAIIKFSAEKKGMLTSIVIIMLMIICLHNRPLMR